MSKLFRRIITVLLLFFLIVQTAYSKQILLQYIMKSIKTDEYELKAEKLTGVLPFYIKLHNCSLEKDSNQIASAKNLSLLWFTPLPLINKNILLERVIIQEPSANTPSSNNKNLTLAWKQLPWGIKIKKILINNPDILNFKNRSLTLSLDAKKNGNFTVSAHNNDIINASAKLKGYFQSKNISLSLDCHTLENNWLDPVIQFKTDITTKYDNILNILNNAPSEDITGHFRFNISRFHYINKFYRYSKKILGDSWHQNGNITITPTKNILLNFTDDKKQKLNVLGSVNISSELNFINTYLSCYIQNLSILKQLIKRDIKGSLVASAKLSGKIFAPAYQIALKSPEINFEGIPLENLSLSLENRIESTHSQLNQLLSSIIKLNAVIDNIPINITSSATNINSLERNIKISIDDDYHFSGNLKAQYKKDVILLNLSEGKYQSFREGTNIENLKGLIIYNSNQLILDNIYSNHPNSKLSINGDVNLSAAKNFPLDIKTKIDNLKAVNSDKIAAVVQGFVNVDGTLLQPLVSGNIDVKKSSFNISQMQSENIPTVEINFTDDNVYTPAIVPKKQFSPILDLNVNIPSNLSIKQGKELSVECYGKLNLKGPLLNPNIVGKIEKINGLFLFNNKVFDITEGVINFNGSTLDKMYLKARAEASINNNNIIISINGPLSDLNLGLSSIPSMILQDILSNILFNSSSDQISALQALRLAQLMLSFSKNKLNPNILNTLGKSIGLDFVEINVKDKNNSASDDQDVSIDIGKYIYKNILFIFHKEILDDRNALGIEAPIGKGFKLEANIDDQSDGKFILKWDKRY